MKVKNVIDSAKINAGMILGKWKLSSEEMKEHLTKSQDVAYQASSIYQERENCIDAAKLLVEIIKLDRADPKHAELVKVLREKLPSHLVGAMDEVGVELPNDTVQISLSLGSLLYDMYSQFCPVPKAPIAIMKHNKTLASLAEEFTKDEFEVTDEIINIIEKPASNDTLWQTLKLALQSESNGKKTEFQVAASACVFFPKVIEALGELFTQTGRA